jgi:cytochrome P450
MIILNSVELARKLFQGKANIYSDRPSLYMQGNLVGWNKTTFLMNDGPELKESRRLIAQEIGTRASITRFIPMIQTRNLNFLRMLLSDRNPEETLEGHLST